MTVTRISRSFFSAASLSLFIVVCASATGCGASAKASANAKAKSNGEADVNFDVEGDAAWSQAVSTESHSTSRSDGSQGADDEPALLGARHDLLLAQGVDAKCHCLVVVLGGPETPGLVWTARIPRIDAQTQLVIAIGSEGVACDEVGTGASYMGYSKKGKDVIVSIEPAVSGRPVAHGAIIPRPEPGGQVIVQPSAKSPYGRGLKGEATCQLGLGG